MRKRTITTGFRLLLLCVVVASVWGWWGARHQATYRQEKQEAFRTADQKAPRSSPFRPIEGGYESVDFRSWLEELDDEQLEATDVLDFLAAKAVNPEQKAAVLESYVDGLPGRTSFPEAERWRNRLAALLKSMDFPADMGLKMGRILTRVTTREVQLELQSHYAENREQLSEGNRLAIVMGSTDERFLASVVDDPDDDVSVRERALSRLARLGRVDRAQEIAARIEEGEDPRLTLTALRIAGVHAEDREDLEEVVEAAQHPFDADELGRNARDLAHVGISESRVSGKSAVVLDSWEHALRRPVEASGSDDELVRTLVTGKALVHALWTESDRALVAALLEGRLLPLVETTLAVAAAKGNLGNAQAIGDFSLEFRRECATRPVPACEDSADPCTAFVQTLVATVTPYLADTELSFYLE